MLWRPNFAFTDEKFRCVCNRTTDVPHHWSEAHARSKRAVDEDALRIPPARATDPSFHRLARRAHSAGFLQKDIREPLFPLHIFMCVKRLDEGRLGDQASQMDRVVHVGEQLPSRRYKHGGI